MSRQGKFKITSFKVSARDDRMLDELVDDLTFLNRSDFIRYAIRTTYKQIMAERNGRSNEIKVQEGYRI